MHVAECGEGFPIVLCHGFPELWYSWRHQLPALAEAGFRAIAPDMRGYGQTDSPAAPADYRTSIICADIAGLLDALDIEKAVIAGHDWGGWHIWQFGIRYPHRTERLIGLNTPYTPAGPIAPTEAMREAYGQSDRSYYILYFQEPGVAEAELGADTRGNLAKIMHGCDRADDLWTFATVGGDGSGVCTNIEPGGTLLTDEELDVYAGEFERTGWTGGLNWYRAMDMSWEECRQVSDPHIYVPTLMITASHDRVLKPRYADRMHEWIPNLRVEQVENSSHWTQQEHPDEVNRLMIDYLADLAPGP